MNLDYKHIIAAVVGIVLGLVGSHYGIDFSHSCPTQVSVSPVVK